MEQVKKKHSHTGRRTGTVVTLDGLRALGYGRQEAEELLHPELHSDSSDESPDPDDESPPLPADPA